MTETKEAGMVERVARALARQQVMRNLRWDEDSGRGGMTPERIEAAIGYAWKDYAPDAQAVVDVMTADTPDPVAVGEGGGRGNGASASPSGHSRAEPYGLGASPECPSRGPSVAQVACEAWRAEKPRHFMNEAAQQKWAKVADAVIAAHEAQRGPRG